MIFEKSDLYIQQFMNFHIHFKLVRNELHAQLQKLNISLFYELIKGAVYHVIVDFFFCQNNSSFSSKR